MESQCTILKLPVHSLAPLTLNGHASCKFPINYGILQDFKGFYGIHVQKSQGISFKGGV